MENSEPVKKHKASILIIENSIAFTGALKSIVRTSYDLSGIFDFGFVIPKGSQGRRCIEEKGFQLVHELPMLELSRRISSILLYVPFLIANAFRLNRLLRQKAVSLIHVNDVYNLIPVALRLFNNRTPYVCHIRFLPNRFPHWLFSIWMKLHFRYATKIVVVSRSVLDKLPPHPKLVLIYGELPMEERYANGINAEPGAEGHTFLYLSNFTQGKGHDFALEAFAKINESIPDWKLRFVGGDLGLEKNRRYKDNLKQKAERLGISKKTEWCGFTSDVELEYRQAGIVLNFSESESFSITCVEALFYGRPLIASNSGGPGEILENGKTGFLVSNRNVEEMALRMRELALNKILRGEFGLQAIKAMREKFSVEKTSFLLREVYDNALMAG